MKNERGSALIIVSILIVVVGVFALNLNRSKLQTAKLQKTTNVANDRKHVERFIRIVLSNPELCKKLVRVGRDNQVQIDKFEFRIGNVVASNFRMENPRYVLGALKLADFSYETRCEDTDRQHQSCNVSALIPLLYQQDENGHLLECKYGSGEKHCDSMGGVWVQSSKTCDLCLGMRGYWQDGRCRFK